ncbi:MAG: hypothetical protein Q7J44_17445 [Pseudotabrizicola sp.]|uniref:hypothetical protein n=1 Tax=Pseudotabrizicola sp. TaxID=2939647 RepID=UPI002723C333|nr:hypothetical protein [Pseudotabrizicola sp.]MDO9640323.1 hypothetical protein [Pseudotabrizicola sp.]
MQLVIWTSDFEPMIDSVSIPEGNDVWQRTIGDCAQSKDALSAIRQAEFLDLLSSPDVLFEHAGAALFELPSGHLSDYFVRIGNLQSRSGFFSAIFFWMIEHLRGVKHIMCDTWSISTSAAVVADYLMIYEGSTSGSVPRISWSYSPSYIPTSPLKERQIFDAVHAAQKLGGKALFLSSFYSSGGLERAIVEQLAEYDARDSAVLIAIYSILNTCEYSELVLCSMDKLLESRGLRGKNAEASKEVEVISVSSTSYFPDYRVAKILPFVVQDIKEDADFWARYCGRELFALHRDGSTTSDTRHGIRRHHAYHVDLDRLFADPAYLKSLANRVQDVAPFRNVFVDGSAASLTMQESLRKVAPGLLEGSAVYTVPDWREISGRKDCLQALNLKGARSIFLLPAVLTGQTIGDLKRHLRETSLDAMPNIHVMIGLLRPSDPVVMKNYAVLGARYSGTGELTVVEKVALPNFGRKECAWCREHDTLDAALGRTDIDGVSRDLFEARRDLLQVALVNGLVGSEVFFDSSTDSRLPFYGGSLFIDAMIGKEQQRGELDDIEGLEKSRALMTLVESSLLSEADLCFVVANAIQNWRNRTVRANVGRATVDAATVVSDDKFNEARLRAAIWRSLRPYELTLAVRVSTGFEDLISRVFDPVDTIASHRRLGLEASLAFGRELRVRFGGLYDTAKWGSGGFFWLPVVDPVQ